MRSTPRSRTCRRPVHVRPRAAAAGVQRAVRRSCTTCRRELTQPGTTLQAIVKHRVASGSLPERRSRSQDVFSIIADNVPATRISELSDGRAIMSSTSPCRTAAIVATHEDITEQRNIEARIKHMAHHDALTDLPNRLLLREQLEQALDERAQHGPIAVLWLDLDRFKEVNDTLGHATGDALLKCGGRAPAELRARRGHGRAPRRRRVRHHPDRHQPAGRRDGARRAPDRGDRRAVPDQRPSDHRRHQRRHLDRAGGRRECRPAAEERRPGALSGQERRPRHLPVLRAGHGRAHACAPPAGDRPARGGRQGRLRAALPAHPGRREQQDHRPRGPVALEPSRARPDRAGRVHPARRGDRADRGDRRVGAAHGLRAG